MSRLEFLRPAQLHDAVARNIPVLFAAGVIEYHGPHLPIGTDAIVPCHIAQEVAQRTECIIAPPIFYGTTMNWAGPPGDGNMDFDGDIMYQYAYNVYKNLLLMGFRRIYTMQYHQGDGEQVLGLKLAARRAIDEYTQKWPEGWGRLDPSAQPDANIFSAIRVMSLTAGEPLPDWLNIGHAGKGETQLVMGCEPQLVDMSHLDPDPHARYSFLKDTHCAKPDEGKAWIEYCVNAWVRELSKGVV